MPSLDELKLLKNRADQAEWETRKRWSNLQRDLLHTTTEIGDKAEDVVEMAKETLSQWRPSTQIKQHPWIALLVAGAAGVFLSRAVLTEE